MNLSKFVSLILVVALVLSCATIAFADYSADNNSDISKKLNNIIGKIIGILLAIINPLCVLCVIAGAVCLALGIFDERKTAIAKKAIITAIIVGVIANSAQLIVNWGTSAL